MDYKLPTLLRVAVLAALCAVNTAAQIPTANNVFKLYKVPRGINWGQSPAEVSAILSRERATITKKENDGAVERWEVNGLFISNLESAGFTFVDKKLEGVELRYRNPKWSEKRTHSQFRDLRILTEHHLGMAAKEDKDTANAGGVAETTETVEWTRGQDSVRLVLFGAKKGQDNFFMVSVHLSRTSGQDPSRGLARLGTDGDAARNLKDSPGAGGPGEALFMVEPPLPDAKAAARRQGNSMPDEPLPSDLFSDENLQAGTPAAAATESSPMSPAISAGDNDILAAAAAAAAAENAGTGSAAAPPTPAAENAAQTPPPAESGAASTGVQIENPLQPAAPATAPSDAAPGPAAAETGAPAAENPQAETGNSAAIP